jgi:mannose-6-phosphate isomerase class I
VAVVKTHPSDHPSVQTSKTGLGAVLLQPDNFTPPVRTPWGGSKIVNKYKRGVLLDRPRADSSVVGESWELSVGPEFPSSTELGISLSEMLASDPSHMLGDEAAIGQTATALLVKWLDAGDNLSVQIHPPEDYGALRATETGKSECWYVVDHERGAGVYLGFRPGVTQALVRETLEKNGDLSRLMQFVPTSVGDLVVIEPGTAHALGAGVTLIEPQYVAPGRRAVTYRYWDWNRRYDSDGKLQAVGGKPRELHVEHALAVTSWDKGSGNELLTSAFLKAGPPDTNASATVEILCADKAPTGLRSSRLKVARLFGDGAAVLPDWNVLRALTVIEGEVRLPDQREGELIVKTGRTVAIAAGLGYIKAHLKQAHALLCAVTV